MQTESRERQNEIRVVFAINQRLKFSNTFFTTRLEFSSIAQQARLNNNKTQH